MRRITAWFFVIVAIACFLCFFSFRSNGNTTDGSFTVGNPDVWFTYTWTADGFSQRIHIIRWSAGAGILGLFSVSAAIKLFRPTKANAENSDAA